MANGKYFYCVEIINCAKDGENVYQAMEHTLNKAPFIILLNIMFFFFNAHTKFVHLVNVEESLHNYNTYECIFLH